MNRLSHSRSWEERDLESSFHGFSDLVTLREHGPVVLSHGEGVYVIDVHDKRYLDANSGLWNTVAGFDHAGLKQAGIDQIRKLPAGHAFFGRTSDVAVRLAERLVSVSPFDSGKVFFANSGSEANDTVVKMLWLMHAGKGRPERRKILTRVNGYHGVTVATASMTGKSYNEVFGLPLSGFVHADCPHHWRFAEPGESERDFSTRLAGNLDALIKREGADTIAGFFAEPVMGAGGVIVPPEGYFEAIQPVLREHDIPLIADEVITGFGRTGQLWGSQTYGLKPDAIVASKCLTAGYFPMGAIILSDAMANALEQACKECGEFPHGFTTAAHPVGCAIALKAIDVILDEGLLENVVAVSPHFQARLKAFEAHPHIGEARGVGLMGALELVASKDTKAPFDDELAVSERFANAALALGLICRPIGQAIVLCPPFIITATEIDELFDKLSQALEHTLS